MAKQRTYRTLNDVSEDYYRTHPEEIDDYLAVAFEEYLKDQNTAALLAQLRIVARAKGISTLAQQTGLTRNGIQKAFSEQGNPQFESIMLLLRAMGYGLVPKKLETLDSPASLPLA